MNDTTFTLGSIPLCLKSRVLTKFTGEHGQRAELGENPVLPALQEDNDYFRIADHSPRIISRQRLVLFRSLRLDFSRLARMRIELDHVFVCTAPGAPEAEEFVRFGLREGPPNRHPGQGTANRRFAFANAMIELLWVNDAEEAQSECSRPTQLWERWSGRQGKASPFGICVRPVDSQNTESPFPAWRYRPSYLPDPLVMHLGEAGVEEPMWVYLGFMRRFDREQRFVEHPIGICEITSLALTTPVPLRSTASQSMVENGILSSQNGPITLLEIEFDGKRRKEIVDFRPHLPVVFQL